MTVIGVISDTHCDRHAVAKVVSSAGKVDAWIHLGDNIGDAVWLGEGVPIYSVAGNCDVFGEIERIVGLRGVKLLITHGHFYGVGISVQRLAYRAEELGCKAALFGHTHMQLLNDDTGVLLLNPGSPSRPRGGARAGYALLYVHEDGSINADLMGL